MFGRRTRRELAPDDLTVLDNGIEFADGVDELAYYWFHVQEREDGREHELFRVVQLRALRYLPQEARMEAGLVNRMRTVITGLYNQRSAQYDLIEIKAGIFHDPPLGILQMYGTIGLGEDLDTARHNAEMGMAAMRGAMSNFAQSRLVPLTIDLANWIRKALYEFQNALVVIGQPEPRQGPRGMGREGPGEVGGQPDDTLATEQQSEMFCRAMAAVQEEFIAVTLASRLSQYDLTRMLAGAASEASVAASQQTGAESVSAGLAIPFSLSGQLARSVGTTYGRNQGHAVADGVADSESTSHTESQGTTVGRSVTEGTAHTTGSAHSSGRSVSTSTTVSDASSHVDGTSQGTADSVGSAHTVGRATSRGGSSSTSVSSTTVPAITTSSGGQSSTQSMGISMGGGSSTSLSESSGVTESSGVSDTRAGSHSQGGGVQAGIGVVGGNWSESAAETIGHGESSGHSESSGSGMQQTESRQSGVSAGVTQSQSSGWSHTPAHTVTSESHTSSSFASTTHSVADTTSESHTESQGTSQADGVAHSVSVTTGRSSFSSSTHSQSDTVSHAETSSWARTESTADTQSHGITRSHGVSHSTGQSVGRSMAQSLGQGFGMGLAPSFSLSRSYQWWNDEAAQLTVLLRSQEELLRRATMEGAYLTDVYVLTRGEQGAAVAETSLRQAYQGSGPLVVTPVQTRRLSAVEQEYIRLHAMAFTQSTREARVRGAMEAYRDSSLLLPLQLAAYMAPSLFEEGVAVTTQERIPTFAYVPDMPGDVILGHQWSTERAELTNAQLRLSQERFFHTVFAADTGFGKTVAAERLVYETTKKWHYRTVVLDFGAGWRRLVNAPIKGWPPVPRVEVMQLYPGARVPFRWNPWQVGKRIQPERQLEATCEIFKNAGRMGPRQFGFMHEAARELYLEHGVLTADKKVAGDSYWNHVRDGVENDAINAARCEKGLTEANQTRVHVDELEPFERQALSVHRSKAVDMAAWVERLETKRQEREKVGDRLSAESLQGALLRLRPFTQGEMAKMYGSGDGTVAVENLGLLGPNDPFDKLRAGSWGITVLEGGAEMNEYAKIAVLGLVAWHLYNDAVVRRREDIGKASGPVLQIVFEEANKILTGVSDDSDDNAAASTSALFQTMWRDGRKYRVFLHLILQTVSDLPPGIVSSCNNGFFGQSKSPSDRDLIMAFLAFSEKGFTDEDYKRFISRMPSKMAVCKLGYSDDVVHTTPFLCRPVMVPGVEPSDEELYDLMDEMKRMGWR